MTHVQCVCETAYTVGSDMIAVIDFLSAMHRRGVRFWLEDGTLCYRCPGGAMSPDDLKALGARRSGIIELLQRERAGTNMPLSARAASDSVPPIAAQQLPWQAGAHSRFCSFSVWISGSLHIDVLRECLSALIQRHELLRTRVVLKNGRPTQIVDQSAECSFDVVDVVTSTLMDPVRRIERHFWEFTGQKIEYSVGPLFAARLLRMSGLEYALILSLDHMITDAISNRILHSDLWSLYKDRINNRPFSLPRLELQFADYALWVNKTHSAWLQNHAPYWKARLANLPRLRFPIDDHPSEEAVNTGKTLYIPFGQRRTSALLDFARRQRVLAALVMLSVYAAAISRWCSADELTLIFVDHGRDRSELVRMVGFLATHLYLRIEVSRARTFLDLLALVAGEYQAACTHRDFNWTFAQVGEVDTCLYFNWLGVDCLGFSDDETELDDLKLRVLPMELLEAPPTVQDTVARRNLADPGPEACRITGLSLFFFQTADQISAAGSYSADCPAPTAIRRFSRNFLDFTDTCIQRPFVSLDSIPWT